MRIEGPKDLSKTGKKSSLNKSRSSGQKFVLGGAPGSQAVSSANAPQTISNIGALIAAQEVDGSTAQVDFAVKRGSDMLDMLDKLKIGLLSGRVAPHTLHRLKTLANEHQRLDGHDNLKKIIGSIELRAEVELAKLAQNKSK